MDIEALKHHPYVLGGAVIGGGLLLYLLMKGGGSGASSSLGAIAGASSAAQQISAASAAQANQVNAQLQATQLQATVANNQTIAAAQAAQDQNDAALVANLIAATTQQKEDSQNFTLAKQTNDLQAQIYAQQLADAVSVNANNNATALAGFKSQLDYGTTLANLQTKIQTQALTQQYNLQSKVVNEVGAAGLNHGTSSLESSLTAILAEVLNQPQIGTAAEAANVASIQSSASVWQSFWNSIGKIGSSVGTAAFA